MRDRLLLIAFLLSGAAALGYEILWTRLLSLTLGNETLGVLGTLGGFFCGLALGSWLLHERARRAAHPVRLFAGLEIVAALYALASPHVLAVLARRLPPLLGPAAGDNDTLLALVVSLGTATLVLLPATVAMGATLAALVEARRRACRGDADGVGLGRLYAANTAGATVGVLATVHVVLPRFGLAGGAAVLAATGLLSAGLALLWARGRETAAVDETAVGQETATDRLVAAPPRRMLLAILALTGFAGLGLEVVGLQILSQELDNTVYTFANLLAVYLVGTALGAWLYARRAARRPVPGGAMSLLLLGHVAAVAIAAFVLRASPTLLELLAPPGSVDVRHYYAELVLSACVFLPATVLMGALFSHLMSPLAREGVGRAYAINTLGATLAPFAFGLGAIQWVGYRGALLAVGGVYVALFLLATTLEKVSTPRRVAGLAAAAVLAVLIPGSMHLVPIPQGWRPVAHQDSVMGLVLVTEENPSSLPDGRLHRRLQINQHFRMGGSLSFGEQRMGHLPLLFAPGARRALYLGLGTGATLSAVRHFPLEEIDAVELVPGVLEVLHLFEHVNEGVMEDPRIDFHAADARRFVAAAREPYDVIVGDLFHPGRDGAGSLYSREHFETVREHLAEGGVYGQWLPLYQFDPDNLRIVVRTFLDVFPEAHSFLGLYNASTPAVVLLGRRGGEGPWIDLEVLEERLREPIYETLLMQDPRDVMASYMLDSEALAAFAGEGPLNTDLAPRVLFDAPKSAYENHPDLAWSSLVLLMQHRGVYPEGFLGGPPERLAAFRREAEGFSGALTHYLRADVLRLRGGPEPGLPQAVVDNYLVSYQKAPEFQPSAMVLYSIAGADPRQAERILPFMLEQGEPKQRTYAEYLGFLHQVGARERFAQILREAQVLFGKEAFPDPPPEG